MQSYGNQASSNWILELAEHETIKEITIKHGFIVDGIGFTIIDGGGNTYTTWHGGQGGKTDKIILKPNEHISQVSGTHDHYDCDGKRHISSLKIHTNLKPSGYGPYGIQKCTKNTTSFSSPSGIISGFYGGESQYLDAISVFIKKDALLKFGPWGNQSPTNWELKLDNCETIREVSVYSGFIVDAIEFTVVDGCGRSTKKVLGNPQASCEKISFRSNEYITQISGKQGVYLYDRQRHIASINIHTNLCPEGYGPYGLAKEMNKISEFSSPMPIGYNINGFFGRVGREYLDSVGVLMKKCGN